MYLDFYRFPFLNYILKPRVALLAALVSTGAVVLGTIFAVRRAALLPPAEAMRPEPPVSYRETVLERMGLKRLLSQPSRMILRHIERRPVKSALTITGIALACSVVILGSFFKDSIDYMVNVQFNMTQREDLAVTFVEPTSSRALFELESLPGVIKGEPFRSVPVRLIHEHRTYRTSLTGMGRTTELQRLLDDKLEQITLPAEGLVLTDHLGMLLGVRPGDTLRVEVLEGARPVREVRVAALVKQYVGVSAYMELSALNRLMREGNAITGANLATDSHFKADIYKRIKEMPRIAGSVSRSDAIRNFYEQMAEQIFIFLFFVLILAGTIAFGVVYNSARIALSERQRELASLRVLGYTRGEISYILLGELAILTLAALPIGFIIGKGLCAYMLRAMQTDLYRIPLVLNSSTYAFAAVVVLVSACLSALIVRRKLDTLDLVEVLKTKE